MRVSPDVHQKPLRAQDLRYPFVDADGRMLPVNAAHRHSEWTAVFPHAANPDLPGPVRVTVSPGEGEITFSGNSWAEWSNGLTVEEWEAPAAG
ncbi:hypothetical protein [Streptosporangium roseum]|uniref:hypothetical protein n=1 Tax=Streptosporangium roseum TaxID=2001 RepID=UPI003321FD54